MKTVVALAATLWLASAALAAPPAGGPRLPPPSETSLDRANISAAITKIKPKVAACGDKHPANGAVKTKVKVAPSGKVETVQITSTPDAALGRCVQAVVKGAVFDKTDRGGSFSYPFMFTKPGPAQPAPTPPAEAGEVPENLDRKAITDAMAKIKPAVVACGDQHKDAKGNVKVQVKVKPDGTVESADIKAAPKPELGTCVANAIRKATFQPTKNGGAFSYPFKF